MRLGRLARQEIDPEYRGPAPTSEMVAAMGRRKAAILAAVAPASPCVAQHSDEPATRAQSEQWVAEAPRPLTWLLHLIALATVEETSLAEDRGDAKVMAQNVAEVAMAPPLSRHSSAGRTVSTE